MSKKAKLVLETLCKYIESNKEMDDLFKLLRCLENLIIIMY